MSAFVELLRKSNLDYVVTRKLLKDGSHSDDAIVASFIDTKQKKLQLIVCLDRPESVTLWSASLDERAFQTNARLLDISELGEMMLFLTGRLSEADFTLTMNAPSAISSGFREPSQVNMSLTHSKNKQSITLHLREHADDGEKASFLSKILLHLYKRNEQLSAEIKAQSRSSAGASDPTERKSSDSKSHQTKAQDRQQMSLINPTVKRRKAAAAVNYGEDNDSD